MKKQGGGRIINILASTVYQPIDNLSLSGATRAGVVAFMKSLSEEIGRDNILVNNVCPGSITSERMLSNVRSRAERVDIPMDQALEERANEASLGRLGRPGRVGPLGCLPRFSQVELHNRSHHPGGRRLGALRTLAEPYWQGGTG